MAGDERGFTSVVLADAGVISALGRDTEAQVKFYARPAPQGVSMPYATYFVVNESPTLKNSTPPSSSRFLIQVDVYSRSKAQAKTIAAAIRTATENISQPVGSRDLYEQTTSAHRVSSDYSFYGV